MYAGTSNIADMLDREVGDQLVDNEEGVKLIINTLEGWYGKESNVDLYQSFVQWNSSLNTRILTLVSASMVRRPLTDSKVCIYSRVPTSPPLPPAQPRPVRGELC